jgi:endonuclease III
LAEANKAEVIEWAEKKRSLDKVTRQATATTLEGGKTFEYIVDVPTRKIVKKIHQVGLQAGGTW